jgi:hypothetical protein
MKSFLRVHTLTALLVLFSNCNPIHGEDTVDEGPWQGCVDPLLPDAKVEIGKETVICMILGNNFNWQEPLEYLRLNFRPEADSYSRFHVPNSFEQLVAFQDTTGIGAYFIGSNITVSAQSQKALSFQKRYYDGFEKIYPYMTVIIDVEDGVVQGIAWDEACIYCGGGRCEENTFDMNGVSGTSKDFGQPTKSCYKTIEECKEAVSEEKTDCDIVLHVVWTGTDKNGKSFMSSASRFSAFPDAEVQERYSRNLPDYTPAEDVDGTAPDAAADAARQ